MTPERRFEAFCARRTREAAAASIVPLVTVEDFSAQHDLLRIGNVWTRRMYDGAFHLSLLPASLPACSLVFVQSRDGNTVAPDPATLGGGAVDRHLLYEGLSRVAADGVLAGAGSVSGRDLFFSVWHPEIVALRAALGLPRHPAQIVMSRSGRDDLARLAAVQVAAAPVFLITAEENVARLARQVAGRPWVHIIAIHGGDLREALHSLRSTHGVNRISVIGGARTATALLDTDLVQDGYLTTTSVSAGEAGTPFYTGSRTLVFDTIVAKQGAGAGGPIRFEHVAFGRPPGPPLQ